MEHKIDNPTYSSAANSTASTFAFPIGNDTDLVPSLDLGKRIEITFFSMGYRSLRDVRCSCKQGRVVLTGRTKTYYQKQVAQVIAGKVAGVTKIENQIEVDQ